MGLIRGRDGRTLAEPVLSIVLCPEPAAHAVVTDSGREIVADELKQAAKSEFRDWLDRTLGFDVADVDRALRHALGLADRRTGA